MWYIWYVGKYWDVKYFRWQLTSYVAAVVVDHLLAGILNKELERWWDGSYPLEYYDYCTCSANTSLCYIVVMIFRQYNICDINQRSHSFAADILGAPPNLWTKRTKWEPDYHLLNNYILDIWDILNMSWTSTFWTCLETNILNILNTSTLEASLSFPQHKHCNGCDAVIRALSIALLN